jgi:hypothetical protein
MRRRNVQMAFIGEGGASGPNPLDSLVDGDEAVEVEITSGKLLVVVPAGTPDEEIFQAARRMGGQLVLENGLEITFEIEDGATGAQFSATPRGEQSDTHPDLSAIPNVPGGA